MPEFKALPHAARIYVILVVFAGTVVIAHSLFALQIHPVASQWFVLAALTLLTGSFTVKVPSIAAYLSVSETFVFVSALMFGAASGTMTVLLECLVIAFWMKSHRGAIHKILFSIAAPALSMWISSGVFFTISGFRPLADEAVPLQALFLPLFALTVLYFLLNSWLVAIAVGFETAQTPGKIWWHNFVWLSVNYFSGASVAALIVTYARALDLSILAIIVPLLIVSYLTFRTAMGRVEDSNKHLSELNRLYLSTIETLAMAIDAKDQVTHGHIRRVQAYAVGLAKRIGVNDETLIKAIEAAALLHDMGKLAVPEHILNKPGKLTEAEFEKMKLHATVGAEILSAIDFPYPVVPIVRHHHENWDGTGYPDGLRGTDIPIGARILSVVDCFDALTSDRPYRPKLTHEDAFAIVKERRGSMYDPLIVDTFMRVHAEIERETITTSVSRTALSEITSSVYSPKTSEAPRLRTEEKSIRADEALALFELSQLLRRESGSPVIGDAIARQLKRLVPFSQFVLFTYDSKTDELLALYTFGTASATLKGCRVPLGQKLSGWVAANRRVIVNSDPALDLGDMARTLDPPLCSCLSTPLQLDGRLVGVLTLYATARDGFADEHSKIISAIGDQLAQALSRGSADIAKSDALESRNAATIGRS